MKTSSSFTESRFGSGLAVVGGIPTMWLLDRKGVLRDLNAVNNLAGKIEKLLNE